MEAELNMIAPTPPKQFFQMMPIGYMVVFFGETIPENFIEVNGQSLLKDEYASLFSAMVGTVLDCGTFFILPTRETILKLFETKEAQHNKIILKVQ